MTEVLYDESRFPEYVGKIRHEKRLAMKSFLGSVAAYLIAVAVLVFLLFPADPLQAKVQGAIILLGIPAFFGILSGVAYWLNRRNPRRITEEAIEAVGKWPLADIQRVVLHGAGKGLEIHLDPKKYRMRTRRLDRQDLLRPEEFLRALEGRVPIVRKDRPSE